MPSTHFLKLQSLLSLFALIGLSISCASQRDLACNYKLPSEMTTIITQHFDSLSTANETYVVIMSNCQEGGTFHLQQAKPTDETMSCLLQKANVLCTQRFDQPIYLINETDLSFSTCTNQHDPEGGGSAYFFHGPRYVYKFVDGRCEIERVE